MLLLGAVILELMLGLVSDGGGYFSRYLNMRRCSYSLPTVGGRTNEKDVKFCSEHLLITYFDLFILDWKSH